MPEFAELFSEGAIIQRLCRIRIKQAEVRHKRLFHRQISSLAAAPETYDPAGLFPPRRQWHRFRQRHRNPTSDKDQNLIALTRATLRLRTEQPTAPWVQRLNERVHAIRQRALDTPGFAFDPPAIRGEPKAPGSDEYRAIARFSEDDQVIEGITARYFRLVFDAIFSDSSLAFRCGSEGTPPPTHHDAVTAIENYRRRHLKSGLWVAECDIRGFFDCVSHEAAQGALSNLIEAARKRDPAFEINLRALQIFDAYLDGYSFPNSVKGIAEPQLKREHGEAAHYKWPEEALREFHPDPRSAAVGIPQGGALSCFIANCVLHHADQEVTRSRRRTPGPFRYLRYCDDMVILAPDEGSCRMAFEAYQQALRRLQLPIHSPAEVQAYGADFWDGKSRQPYRWVNPRDDRDVPWLQFVGYQIRHDGMLRVKRKSIEKHKAKILDETDRLLRTLMPSISSSSPPNSDPGIRKTPGQILHRFRQKLIAMSVGRRDVHHDLARLMPKCWATGFKMVHGRRLPLNALKELDRFRERQIARIRSVLGRLPHITEPHETAERIRAPRFYGFPFSYVGQFAPTGKIRGNRNRRREENAEG